MEKTINVTITVDKNENVSFWFCESESGCEREILTYLPLAKEKAFELGEELISWASLVADEMEESEEC